MRSAVWLGLCLAWAVGAAAQTAPPSPPATSPDDVCTTLLERGRASFKAGDTVAALAAFEEAARIADAAGLKRPLADALYRIGVAHNHRREFALAKEPLDRAEALSREVGDQRELARIWNHRGLQARPFARFDEAGGYLRRSVAIVLAREEKSLELDPRNSYADTTSPSFTRATATTPSTSRAISSSPSASNTLVSLWKVDATSTAELTVAFHHRARGGEGYAESLRTATLTLLHDRNTRHPFYWAPFVLIGDGRPHPAASRS